MEDGTVKETLAGTPQGRVILTVAGEHLPEQTGSDLGGAMFVAWEC